MAETPKKPTEEELAGKAFRLAADTDALVEQWVTEYFPESVITRNSEGWLLFQRATKALKQRLKGE